MSDKPGGVAAPDAAPGSPSGEWSDEQHHVAPEGAQRLGLLRRLTPAQAALLQDLLAGRARADRADLIVARVDAAEHDPGTPEAWADGCECERQDPRASEWDVTWGCPMHDPREG